MHGDLAKLHLADRTEAILRCDRNALRRARRTPQQPAILLALVPDSGDVIDLMDAHLPEVAGDAGLQYVRLVGTEMRILPRHLLHRTFLTVADLTGRNKGVITLVYQMLAMSRSVLLAARTAAEIPWDLRMLPSVIYHPEHSSFDQLLREVRHRTAARAAGQLTSV